MWHEARKQEKKIREAVVDFQKRAERRRQHYAKQRRDPMQLLRLYGTRSPLHLNPTASKMSSTMIPWQGDETNMISRYDVRINLDYIPEHAKLPRPKKSMLEEWEEQRCNYERYRFLVLNQFRGVSEQDALAAIEVNEMYLVPGRPSNSGAREKAKSQARAAIGYRYGGMEDGESEQERRDEQLLADYLREDDDEEDEEKAFSSESEYEVDIDVDQYSSADVDKLNVTALEYGIAASAFSRNLRSEKQHMEETKLARLNDLEKSALPVCTMFMYTLLNSLSLLQLADF
jgi:arginine/serine-rich splicing factor 16